MRNFLKNATMGMLSIILITISITMPISAESEIIDEITEYDNELNDDEKMELLKLYHSEGTDEDVEVTEEDLAEFEMYYSFLDNTTNTTLMSSRAFFQYYGDYFKYSTNWKTRSNGITLAVNYHPQNMYINTNNPNVQAANASHAFKLLKGRWISTANWRNSGSMEAQFHCHVVTVGKLKNPWNLEPWRTTTSLPATIAAGCNPS